MGVEVISIRGPMVKPVDQRQEQMGEVSLIRGLTHNRMEPLPQGTEVDTNIKGPARNKQVDPRQMV